MRHALLAFALLPLLMACGGGTVLDPADLVAWDGPADDERARAVDWLRAAVELGHREDGRDLLDPGQGRRRGVRPSDLRLRKTLQAVSKDTPGYLSLWNAELRAAQRQAEHVVSEPLRDALHAWADRTLTDYDKLNVRSGRPLFRKEFQARMMRIAEQVEALP